jgi:hypothetical protein
VIYQWYLLRQHRKRWSSVCDALGVPFAQPVAMGAIDGVPVVLAIDEPTVPVTISTELTSVSFAPRKEDPDAPEIGDWLFDAKVALRGDPLVWRRALDRPTRDALADLAFYSTASLRAGTLKLTESLKVTAVNPSITERVEPIRRAVSLVKRLAASVASKDDAVVFEAAFGDATQRERLNAIRLLQDTRADDPRLAEGLARLSASKDAGDRMLALLARGDHAAVVQLASEPRTPSRVMTETVDMLRALYPHRAASAMATYDRTIGQRTTPISPSAHEHVVGAVMSIAIAHSAFYAELDRDQNARRTIIATIAAFAES